MHLHPQVMWFKNPPEFKSVKDVEHFHVMLYNPPPQFVNSITGGDMPTQLVAEKFLSWGYDLDYSLTAAAGSTRHELSWADLEEAPDRA